jgi:hypothetical protein
MRRNFIIEFDYFNNRKIILDFLNKIAVNHSRDVLTGFSVFINNIPTSLEFYAFLSYEKNPNNEIEEMKDYLFSNGIYRPDISLETLFSRIADRGFNSFPIDPGISFIEHEFYYHKDSDVPSYQFFSEYYKKRLESEGYKAFEKLGKGTSIFLSHSSKQKEVMENITPYLNSKNELVWIDKYRLKPTEDFDIVKREIAIGLNQANKVLFYITLDFLESDWCNYELELSHQIMGEKSDYSLHFIIECNAYEQFIERFGKSLDDIPAKNIKVLKQSESLESETMKFMEII